MLDLKEAPYNPRVMDADALRGLRISMEEFGDLSGIVVNRRTGHLVAGHQRVKALRERWGELVEWRDGALWTPSGETFRVREVDWEEEKERAANLAANAPAIQGRFSDGLFAMIEELEARNPAIADILNLRSVPIELIAPPAEGAVETMAGPPEMELQPFEHYDYVVVLATSMQDWLWLVDFLKLERVDGSSVAAVKKIGVGRAVKAQTLIGLVEAARAAR